ncbi:MAG: glycosyltransferase family 2 protein [Candidatus Shapirobacteria bacterium]|nr:glycosyltransferase family 2 protein [Candidatus Shapirobacteria bacterium]
MKKGLVSIIVPIYNAENYLAKCVGSISCQSYKNFEMILIDDGSGDNSGRMCDKYAAKNKMVKVIHKKNAGPAAARNDGLKISEGKYIFFMDADDFIEKNALELLVAGYDQSKADLVIGDFKKIKNFKTEIRNDIFFDENKLLKQQDIIEYTRFYLKKPNKYLLLAFSWGRLFKSSIIRNNKLCFSEKLHTFEDVAFNFDYLRYTKKVFFINTVIYNHLIYDNLSSATTAVGDDPSKLFGYKQALQNVGAFLKGNISDEEIKQEVGHAYVSLTIIQLVRICGQINGNEKNIFRFVQGLVKDLTLRDNLKYYHPSKGESKIIPLLIKLKLVQLVLWICEYKAYKRYKRRQI